MAAASAEGSAGRSGDRAATWLLGASIFATGFCGLVSEFVLGTVSSYILGNSVEQFSVIIALMMLAMGVAGAAQRFFPDRHLIEQFIAVEALLALMGGFAPLAIYAAWGGLQTHFLLVLYFFAGGIGLLIGFELPLVLRINAQYARELPSNLAVILSLDYIGGFVGAMVWTRFLLRELPLPETSLLIAGLNFAVASVTFLYFGRQGRVHWPGAVLAAVLAIAVLIGFGLLRNREWSDRLEQRLYDDRIVFAETTPYQRVVITHDPITDDHRLFLNGNLQLSSLDEVVYHEQLVHPLLALAERRDRVLILGGGDGLALREVLKYQDVEQVVLVDLDPRMTQIAATNPVMRRLNGDSIADARVRRVPPGGISPGGRRPVYVEFEDSVEREAGVPAGDAPVHVQRVAQVDIVNVDADRFLDSVTGLWDAVVVDFPDPSSVEVAKLYSREFYRKLGRVLAPGGLVALQATSPYHAREAFLCIRRTLESAGFETVPYQDEVPSFGSWGWILAGRRGGLTHIPTAPRTLTQRAHAIESLAAPTRYLTAELFRSSLVFGKGRLVSRHDEVNTLMRPLLLDLYLRESWLAD